MSTASDTLTVTVPDIGDFSGVPVIEILVSPGDEVAPEDPLVTLESDKATMDVPAPSAGVVGSVLVKVGDRVSQGSPVIELTGTDAASPPQPATEGATTATAPAATRPDPAAPIYASPSVRRLARELGVDLRGVTGTGRKGRIVAEDVRGGGGAVSAGGPQATGATGTDGLGLAPWPSLTFERFGPVERVPRSRIQRISAPNLARNWVRIPHVTQNDEADITELEAWRRRLNAEQSGVKVTMVAFLVVATVATLKAFPDFNSSLDGDELIVKRYWNIGFAADTPHGLVVPVITGADTKGLLAIAADLAELSAKARAGALGPADISGSTFTISSLGGIGGTSFTPIINAPEVAILGATRAQMKPVWSGTEFVPRLMLPLSLSYDHRVIDGAAAARFLVHLASVLADLRQALL